MFFFPICGKLYLYLRQTYKILQEKRTKLRQEIPGIFKENKISYLTLPIGVKLSSLDYIFISEECDFFVTCKIQIILRVLLYTIKDTFIIFKCASQFRHCVIIFIGHNIANWLHSIAYMLNIVKGQQYSHMGCTTLDMGCTTMHMDYTTLHMG